jgi:hypothetical protein
LQKLGLPLKKKSPHAAERDTPEVQEERREFGEEVEPIEPRRLVFVKGTGVTTMMTPAYDRAPKGERVEALASASWESVTVVAAMGLSEVRASQAFEGAINAATFPLLHTVHRYALPISSIQPAQMFVRTLCGQHSNFAMSTSETNA